MADPSHTPTRKDKQPPPVGNTRVQEPTTGLFITKMTDSVVDTIVMAIEGQSAPETACTLAGVNVRTFRQWLATGRAWLDEHGAEEIPIPEAVVVARVEMAMAKARNDLELGVATDSDWRAKERTLQARYPRDWGKRERVDIGNPDGETFHISGYDLSVLDRDELVALKTLLLKLQAASDNVIDMPSRQIGIGS